MTASTRGILYPARLPTFTRLPPPPSVADLVRWFWVPQWDVDPGRTSRQHVVAFPACNLVVESGAGDPFAALAGPTTRRSHRDLTGRGWAVGALLRPAAVPAFTDDPAALRDAYVRVEAPDLVTAVSAAMSTAAGAQVPAEQVRRAVGEFARRLAARVPEVTAEGRLANAVADLLDGDPSVLRLEDAASRLGVSARTLQRLARRHVGLPPAAMIRRRRLQEAAERLRTDPGTDLAALAADLGYADHGHLTRDFRAVLGTVPSEYRREHPAPGAS
ncbi:helix-turn-helix domain-containing protein [Kineococcus sp. SYSU DK006]|uniref:helix-turn-helix domain-containing protein n=1 Tax=Kineococcus sp. SYSU DK006 TaxID=3383127 RepID=UPI003D7E7F1D